MSSPLATDVYPTHLELESSVDRSRGSTPYMKYVIASLLVASRPLVYGRHATRRQRVLKWCSTRVLEKTGLNSN